MSEVPLISIVDDDALVGDGIAAFVESLGYNAVTFTSAEQFLRSDVIAETTCLITDVQMPGLNGLELQEALKSQGHLAAILARRSGCGSYLYRPISVAVVAMAQTTSPSKRDTAMTRRIAANTAKLPELLRKP